MIENFTTCRVETSEDTRKRAVAALGLDEPSTTEKLDRRDYPSDEAYFHACAELALRNNSPEYRREYQKIRREHRAKKAEEEAAAEQKHQEEIKTAIRDCVLSPDEQTTVDNEARRRAQADLAAGKISFQQIGAATEEYAAKLSQGAKEEKVHRADFNAQLRAAMLKVCGRTGKA